MKIVCDFDTIRTELDNMDKSIENMDAAITKYISSLESDLSSWKGIAKDSFDLTNDDQVTTTKTHVSELTAITVFVREAVSKIESLEGALSGLDV